MHRTPLAGAAALLLVGAVVAGCLSPRTEDGDTPPDAPQVPPDWAARALAHGDGHAHSDRAAHANLSTPNFRVLGWDPLVTEHHGTTSGDHFCGGVSREGERRIAAVHSFGTDVAFVLADVTDPAEPRKLGEFVLKRAQTYDVDITPDGDFVVIATNPRTDPPDPATAALPLLQGLATTTLEMEWRDACTRERATFHEEVPFTSGVVLVDVSDPAAPAFVEYQPTPFVGPHSIHTTATDDGTVWVLASITNLAHPASYFQFYTIDSVPLLGPRLVPFGLVQSQYPDADAATPLTNGHVDGWIQTHPATGDNLAYLANWNGGLLVVRLDGPGQLTTIGTWNDYTFDPVDPDAAGMTGAVHSAYPLSELWDGRHYTVIGQEVGSRPAGRPTGQMILLDTTEPAAPTPVARWTLPHDMGAWGETGDEFLLFSTHYPAVIDRTLFVSMYHGGVWAVDLAPDHWPELPSRGVFLPDRASPEPPGDDLPLLVRWTPVVLDVIATPEGRLIVWDGTSGVYVLEYDDTLELPATAPWTEDAWIG